MTLTNRQQAIKVLEFLEGLPEEKQRLLAWKMWSPKAGCGCLVGTLMHTLTGGVTPNDVVLYLSEEGEYGKAKTFVPEATSLEEFGLTPDFTHFLTKVNDWHHYGNKHDTPESRYRKVVGRLRGVILLPEERLELLLKKHRAYYTPEFYEEREVEE